MAEQFRIAVFGEGRAPWRTSRSHALDDAKGLGLASFDRAIREWFLAVPVEMEKRGRADHVEPQPRDRRGLSWTHAELIEMRSLASRGDCARIIGRRMGRTPAAVSQKARRAGVVLG